MKNMKRIYKMHDMIVWEDATTNKSCAIFSVSDYDWTAIVMDKESEEEIGSFSKKDKAFNYLKSYMENFGYSIAL